MKSRLKVSEKAIQNTILEYLKLKKIFAWQNDSVGIYDLQKKKFRFNPTKMKGVADIIGIYRSKFLAIECKSQNGRLNENQKHFLDRVVKEGGISIVARDIKDVEEVLQKIQNKDRAS